MCRSYLAYASVLLIAPEYESKATAAFYGVSLDEIGHVSLT